MSRPSQDENLITFMAKKASDDFCKDVVRKYKTIRKKPDLNELFNLMETNVGGIFETYKDLLRTHPQLKNEIRRYFYARVIHELTTSSSKLKPAYELSYVTEGMKRFFKDFPDSFSCIEELSHIRFRDIYSVPSLQQALREQPIWSVRRKSLWSEWLDTNDQLNFLLAIERYFKGGSNVETLRQLYVDHIKTDAPHNIGLSSKNRDPIEQIITRFREGQKVDVKEIEEAFINAQKEISERYREGLEKLNAIISPETSKQILAEKIKLAAEHPKQITIGQKPAPEEEYKRREERKSTAEDVTQTPKLPKPLLTSQSSGSKRTLPITPEPESASSPKKHKGPTPGSPKGKKNS